MRWRPGIWLLLVLLFPALFFLGGVQRRFERQWAGATGALAKASAHSQPQIHGVTARHLRLTNTSQGIGELLLKPTAVLLENALLDTAEPVSLGIPEHLRAKGAPGAYIVQCRGSVDSAFRTALSEARGSIVSFIPNNSFLVRTTERAAEQLKTHPRVNAVLPYEPYYKLKSTLLKAAVDRAGLPAGSQLRVLLFKDKEKVGEQLAALGAETLGEERSPFGPVLRIRVPSDPGVLPAMAGLPGVQELELLHARVPANDLSRAALGVAVDPVAEKNYLDLGNSGTVIVGISDTGIDPNHPDLKGRVFADANTNWPAGPDLNGHGTHVAGIVAGNGSESATVVHEVEGSTTPAVGGQFRGKAPGARLFSMNYLAPDTYLQAAAAQTNIFISNNSWNYEANEYDLAAASYDAAVRDALPEVTGPQPLLFVFPAGNAGTLNTTATTNEAPAPPPPDTILSPGTAKNVITVGAAEQFREVTNSVLSEIGGNQVSLAPWASSTDSGGEVAFFSARGNVGIGVEGQAGRFKPDVVAPGTFVVSTRSTTWDQAAYYDPALQPPGTTFQVLSNLNEQVGPFYRYESGSSMAAAQVSGTLALMQEFLQDRLKFTNSPALMKALLINGARSLGPQYGINVGGATNHQGWGLVNLTNSLPASLSNLTASSMLLLEQTPARALSTGQKLTFQVAIAPEARHLPLRITLVWTDPPANPLAAVKLVNDLDLVVTNLSSGEVFLGNDFSAGGRFSNPASGAAVPDHVNNVENVYLQPPLAAQYSITTKATAVNVNAVTADTDVVQDFAMVISSGNGEVTNALSLPFGLADVVPDGAPKCIQMTNSFGDGPDFGSVLLRQRVGAFAPLLSTNAVAAPDLGGQISIGSSCCWRFYQLTNAAAYTNAAFATFMAHPLAAGPKAATAETNGVVQALDADIDLYVSTDRALTNLEPSAVLAAARSVQRGGSEAVLLSNAVPAVYYIGVKSEAQDACEFNVAAVFSDVPFSEWNTDGNLVVRGLPANVAIPDANSGEAAGFVLALTDQDFSLHKAVVTDVVSHESVQDLIGTLAHDGAAAVLNNRRSWGAVTNLQWVFDDTQELDMPGAEPTDGPGTLTGFAGHSAAGVWVLSEQDMSAGHLGTNNALTLLLEPQQDVTGGLNVQLVPGACRTDLLYVPDAATNLTLSVNLGSGTGPLQIELCPEASDGECVGALVTPDQPAWNASLAPTSDPRLRPGLYLLRSCNTGPDALAFDAKVKFDFAAEEPSPTVFQMITLATLLDDAVTKSVITITNQQRIGSLTVGVGVEHPRISDLAISLVSPAGTRVLLSQNRGGDSKNMGMMVIVTNVMPVSSSGGPQAYTNVIDTGKTSGTIDIHYYFYERPDNLHVYYESDRIFNSEMVNGSGTWLIPYGPGDSTVLTVVVNEGGNYDPETAWDYVLTSTRPEFMFAQFAENTNLAATSIKFAVPPFTNVVSVGDPPAVSNAIFFLPEQSLDAFRGEMTAGNWTLEIRDSRAGATLPTPALIGWELSFLFDSAIPVPLTLSHGMPWTVTVRPGHLRLFEVDVPSWASFATNSLVASSSPVNLWYNRYTLPFGTNAADMPLLTGSIQGTALASSADPRVALDPGHPYFLAVQNTNPSPVTFTLQVDFDISLLQPGVPLELKLAPNGARYFLVLPSADVLAAIFELSNLTANADLVLQKGVPLPTLTTFDYGSFNPSTNTDELVVYSNSVPVPLSHDQWYLGVFNREPGALACTLSFTERFSTDLAITGYELVGDSLCLTWAAMPGKSYQVQGRVDMLDSSPWITLSAVVIAADLSASTCIPFCSGLSYFRIREAVPPGNGATVIRQIQTSDSGVFLEWVADVDASFHVQWTDSLEGSSWSTIADVVSSANGEFSYLDDGSQTGGLTQPRFYRLTRVP